MKTPKSMHNVVEEIDQVAAAGGLSEFVTWKQAQNMPYLQACIKEALRKRSHGSQNETLTKSLSDADAHTLCLRHAPRGRLAPRTIRPQGRRDAGRPLPSRGHHCGNQSLGRSVSKIKQSFIQYSNTWQPFTLTRSFPSYSLLLFSLLS